MSVSADSAVTTEELDALLEPEAERAPMTWGADFAAAFVAAQGAFEQVVKNETAEVVSDRANYTYDYATLSAYHSAARAALAANALGFMQDVWTRREYELDDNKGKYVSGTTIYVETILIHSSGQFKKSRIWSHWIPGGRITEVGACSSYLKRYQLIAQLGMAAAEDNETNLPAEQQGGYDSEFDQRSPPPSPRMWPTGSARSGPSSSKPAAAAKPASRKAAGAEPPRSTGAAAGRVNGEQLHRLATAIDKAGVTPVEFCRKYQIDELEAMPFAKLNDALAWLKTI